MSASRTPPEACRPWLDGRIRGPEGPIAVEDWRETHTCWVLLSSDRAFKLRKPVDLGFLDYSTPAVRRRWTAEELALGRRISPHVYLGVWELDAGAGVMTPVEEHADAAAGNGADAEPVLVMQRLDESLCASRAMADPETPLSHIDGVVADCARFHAEAPVDSRPDGWGSVEATERAWTINFEQMPEDDPLLPLSAEERARLVDETALWLAAHRHLLVSRIAAGRIREGHGDLRLEHVYLTRPWSVIDPLEFSRELRFCDVAAEVGFLAMELDELGRPDAANHLIARYAAVTEDDSLVEVAPFFKRYRAAVRAKVEWIRATQVEGEEREAHLARARGLFELGVGYGV